jgi:alpha-tubulin suppressor-like RCC1 family protein
VIQNGTVLGLGANPNNQLGINSATASYSNAQLLSFPSSIAQVASGGGSSLALSTSGLVYSWGTNSFGATGQGTVTGSIATPTLVSALTWNSFPVTQIAMGDGISAIVANGSLYTCGINTEGGLGLATNFNTATPVTTFTQVVFGQTNYVVSVACGQRHMVVQLANNSIVTFGRNTAGQLGSSRLNSTNQYNNYIPTYNITNPPIQVNASANSSLEEHFDNTTKCYGSTGQSTKLMVSSQANHTVLVTPTGAVYAWGYNTYGQLGNNTPGVTSGSGTNSAIPLAVSSYGSLSGKTIVAIACGGNHTIALDTLGAVHAWGNNGYGQLGNNTIGNANNAAIPIIISSVAGSSLIGKTIVAIAGGGGHTIALDSFGTVHAWGSNNYGQLGNNTPGATTGAGTNLIIPLAISSSGSLWGKTIVAIACGDSHTIALDSVGVVHAWGFNGSGQLGNNTNGNANNAAIPIIISSVAGSSLIGKTIVAIAGGGNHTIALDSLGAVHAWGNNIFGQLGNNDPGAISNSGTNSLLPLAVSSYGSLSGKIIVASACGNYHTIALDSLGAVHAWGYNGFGELGNNTTNNSGIPLAISSYGSLSGKTIVAIACGYGYTIALDSLGAIHVWGHNQYGQLGNNTPGATANTGTASAIPLTITPTYLALATTAPVAVSFTPFFVNFTGQHRVFVAGTTINELGNSEGFIVVCDQNDYITAPGDAPLGKFSRGQSAITINDALPIVSLAKKAYDKRVFGVMSPYVEPLGNSANIPDAQGNIQLAICGDVRTQVNAIGEGAIWVTDVNGPLESGDWITSSSIPGYGQLQTGSMPGVFQNFTVAKITCDCDFTAPLKNKKVIQTDENGLNVIDPVSGWPVWINETHTTLVDSVSTIEDTLEPAYKMRYLLPDGTQISFDEYTQNQAADPVSCYRAAFVGCTYHCG